MATETTSIKKRRAATEEMEELSMSPKTPLKKKLLTALIVFCVLVTAVAVYSVMQLIKLKDPKYQQQMVADETNKVLKAVGELMELPAGVPQIATVADVELLKKNQPFFNKAMNGDQILVFTDTAVLYRPSTHKIINVAPVNREQPTADAPKVETPSTTPTTATPVPSTQTTPAKPTGTQPVTPKPQATTPAKSPTQ